MFIARVMDGERSPTKSSCTGEKRLQTLKIKNWENSLRSACDHFNVISIDNDFVKEQAFVLSFSSSGTKRCFWTLTALLKVGDLLNILMLK